MTDTHTDCRDSIGVTVGILDAIMVLCGLLIDRDLSDPAIKEALKDLKGNSGFKFLIEILDKEIENE